MHAYGGSPGVMLRRELAVAATSNIHRTAWLARVRMIAQHLFFETMVEVSTCWQAMCVYQTNHSYRNRQPIRANRPFHCWLGLVGLRLHSTRSTQTVVCANNLIA